MLPPWPAVPQALLPGKAAESPARSTAVRRHKPWGGGRVSFGHDAHTIYVFI